MNSNKLLFGVAESASYNVLIQVFFRIQTFILNGFIIRFISNDILGIMNVRLFLLYSTVTFLSTESFRQACITNPKSHDWRQVINLMWLMIPVTILIAVTFGYVWIEFLEQPEKSLLFQYKTAVWIIVVSCIVERIAEPIHIIAQIYLFNKLTVVARSLSIASQSIILAAAVYFSPSYAILAFSIGQAARSLLFVLIFYIYFAHYFQKESLDNFKSLRDFLPQIISDKINYNKELGALTWSFFKQGILKQILTEGERYMMTVFNILNFAEQGVYDVVSNLGSLAARFIFRPIEESSYQFFAQLLSRQNIKVNQNNESTEMGANVLQHLLKVKVLMGLIIVSFGCSYSFLLLHLYGGKILSSGAGPSLMRWQCIYVLMIAVNGITECFAFATMNKKDLDRFNFIMILISIVFLSLAWYLTQLFSAVGFILANCANMLCRICHSVLFIKKFFQETPYTPLRGLFPHPVVLGAIGCSYLITSVSEVIFCCNSIASIVIHISTGVLCLVVVGLSIFFTERELITFFKNEWIKRKTLKQE